MNIYFSGIGGAGIGPLAEIALDAGFAVFGSDLNHSLQTAELENRGVRIFYEQNAETIAKIHDETPIDWLVYTSALPDDAPELEFARANNIRATKRDEFLAEFIEQKKLKLLAIAGTHGKTTTTALLVWVFRTLKIPVSYSVGTTLSFGASGRYDPKSEFFIYEADEYDRNFLNFRPYISLISSLEFDHADIYETPEKYDDAFREFVAQSGKVLLWQNDFAKLFTASSSSDLFRRSSNKNKKLDYPNKSGNDEQKFPEQAQNDKLIILNEKINRDKINLAGQFMRDDAWLVVQLFREIWAEIARSNQQIIDNFDEKKIANILAQFPGSARRFENLGQNLYSDYAHHPTEIAATLGKARELSEKIVVVYQPHQNRRQIEIMNAGGYKNAFDGADKVFWLPTYLNRMDLMKGAPAVLTPADLIATLDDPARKIAEPAEMNDDLFKKIENYRARGDLVLIMGAGPIDGWIRGKLNEIY